MNIFWEDWCWSWNSNTLATWCEELTHLKRLWCWERLKAGGEGDNRGWDGWMASLTRWTWVWVSSRSWWWTGKPGVLPSVGSQRVGHDWATELNWITAPEKSAWIHQAKPVLPVTCILGAYTSPFKHSVIHGVTKSRTRLSAWTELNWTIIKNLITVLLNVHLSC